MADVLAFTPTLQSLENVPHMLRYWADVIDKDQAAGTKTHFAALVLVQGESATPAFFISGAAAEEQHNPLYVAGIFDWCRTQLLAVVEQESLHD